MKPDFALNSTTRRWLTQLTIIVVMWLFFGQLTFGARQLSMTSDEPPHLVNGYVMLTTGDAWAVPAHGHPPLVNMWSAWPLLLQPVRPDPRTVPYWGTDFIKFVRAMWPLLGPIERMEFVTRAPIMLIATVLMALVYRWARERFGHWGGLLAIGVMAFDPTMLAHSQLDTTDLGVTLFAFACLYLTDQLLRRFSWRRLAGVGLTLGAALATKPSGLILVPVLIALMGWGYLQETRGRWWAWLRERQGSVTPLIRTAGRWASWIVTIMVIGLGVLWATYGFQWSMPPLVTHIRMLEIFFRQNHGLSFLNGELSSKGWWWYFPFAAAVKSPLPLLIGIGAAFALALRQWKTKSSTLAFWLFPFAYGVTALQSDINLGYRHMLPIFPFLYVGLARLGPMLSESSTLRWRSTMRWVAATLGVWYVLGTVRVYPFPLAYFNELVGGPQNGYHYLVDSNVDWGQSFKALKVYMDRSGLQSVWLSYFTWIDPAVYGIRYEPLPPAPKAVPTLSRRFDPEPGTYAISASNLQGIMVKDSDTFEWFRHRQPSAQPGYGLLVYLVPPRQPPATWVAQCAAPAAPLDPEHIAQGFGRADLRLAYFDCRQSWLMLSSGQTSGWYVLRRDIALSNERFITQRLKQESLSYEQRQDKVLPAFAIYEHSARASEAACSGRPEKMNGPLNFLGSTAPVQVQAGQAIEVDTCWQVTALPERPLSIMLHLVSPDGTGRLVADGLGVPIEQWQVGDVIVQRHKLSLAPGAPAGSYQLLTGVYWLDTLQRWRSASGADTLTLEPIAVKTR